MAADHALVASERFSLDQRPASYHYFIRGRPVCLETYTEVRACSTSAQRATQACAPAPQVCAMTETTMQEVRSLARSAALENLDLINDPPPVDLGSARLARQQQREVALKVFLTALAEASCACC